MHEFKICCLGTILVLWRIRGRVLAKDLVAVEKQKRIQRLFQLNLSVSDAFPLHLRRTTDLSHSVHSVTANLVR